MPYMSIIWIHLLVQGLVVEVKVTDEQLCGPQDDHLILVVLVGFVILVFPQLFPAEKHQ